MAEAALKEVVPQEFHDRPYLKDLLDKPQGKEVFAEVFKKLDGAQKLVGKKPGLPAADAPAEEWESVFKQLRPEKEDSYEIQVRTGEKPDVEMGKALKSAFHAAGLSTVQAKKFQDTIMPVLDARRTKAVEAQKKLEDEFESLTKATFGGDNEKVLEKAKAALEEHVPKEFTSHIGTLDNKSLMILVAVVHTFLTKFGKEDNLGGGKGAGGGAETDDLREEARKLQASPAWKDLNHADHAKTEKRVNEIYDSMRSKSKK